MSLRNLLPLSGACLALAACHGSSPPLREVLGLRYAALTAAMANKDAGAIRRVLADRFISVDVGGRTESAADMIKEVLALPADPTRRSQITIVAVKGDGRSAVVEQRYRMTQQMSRGDGVEHSVALSTLSRDRWINDHGSWRIARTVTEQMDYSVDGVTMAHGVNPAAS